MKTKKTHKEVILQMLKEGQVLTPSNVFKTTKSQCKTGCMKLSTRIGELVYDRKIRVKKTLVRFRGDVYMKYQKL